jgi:hypothetical protein
LPLQDPFFYLASGIKLVEFRLSADLNPLRGPLDLLFSLFFCSPGTAARVSGRSQSPELLGRSAFSSLLQKIRPGSADLRIHRGRLDPLSPLARKNKPEKTSPDT